MKQILPLFLLGAGLTLGGALNAQAQDVKAGTITSQSADTKANAVNVTLTGALTSTANGDFRQLRDLCWQMRSLNLQMASVTAIPDNALHSRHRLHELVLPNKLLTIGRQAFFACDSLEGTLVIPDKVTVVGPSAFNGCRSLTGLKLSKAMVSLGSYAFAGCTSLEGEVNLPESMLTLRDGVFARCSSLQRVTLPTSLQRIGANAFSGCSSLEGDIVMGRMLTHIGASAFAGCSKLQTLSLPRALQQVGEGAFADCSALTGRISLPASVQDLGLGAFQGCSGIEEVVLPESLAQVKAATFAGCDGILVPGGFGYRGVEGKIAAIRYARENRIPFFGICLGMQCAVIEFARHVAGLEDANSEEFDPLSAHKVIYLMTEWFDFRTKNLEKRDAESDKGGTMRLGAYPCKIIPDTRAFEAYGKELVEERHRHRYEFNNAFKDLLEEKGMVFSGTAPDGSLMEIVELPDHPWFLGCQFHPEFKSRPMAAHPLFREFIKAAKNNRKK